MVNPDSYVSLDLVVQGLLFLFHEPEYEDTVNPGMGFPSMATLQNAVDRTKYGGIAYVYATDWIPFHQ